jgi:hypothetical protein
MSKIVTLEDRINKITRYLEDASSTIDYAIDLINEIPEEVPEPNDKGDIVYSQELKEELDRWRVNDWKFKT